jgi:hypothetical protein
MSLGVTNLFKKFLKQAYFQTRKRHICPSP